jgi:hypothetical protein
MIIFEINAAGILIVHFLNSHSSKKRLKLFENQRHINATTAGKMTIDNEVFSQAHNDRSAIFYWLWCQGYTGIPGGAHIEWVRVKAMGELPEKRILNG